MFIIDLIIIDFKSHELMFIVDSLSIYYLLQVHLLRSISNRIFPKKFNGKFN